MSSLRKHIDRSERERVTPLLTELAGVISEARAKHDRLRERALDALEREYGINADRVNERGGLEVTPEEFARLRSTSVQLAGREEPSPITDFEIRVFVIDPMCDRTEACPATKEHFLSCRAAPWKLLS